jgi:hypothetical protein
MNRNVGSSSHCCDFLLQLYRTELITVVIVIMVVMTVRAMYMTMRDFFCASCTHFNHIQSKPK